jgi:hypothetical protein
MLKNFTRLTLALALAAVSATGAARAQSTTQGAIAGSIFDATDAAIPGAKVVITTKAPVPTSPSPLALPANTVPPNSHPAPTP